MIRVTGKFGGSRRLVTAKSPTWIMLRGSHEDVSGFQTIATCRDVSKLKNSRGKSATSPFASPCLHCLVESTRHGKVGDVADKATKTSQVCRRLVADVTGNGMMEFGLKHTQFADAFFFVLIDRPLQNESSGTSRVLFAPAERAVFFCETLWRNRSPCGLWVCTK